MADQFSDYKPGLSSPATSAQAITPSDGVAIDPTPRALYVGTGGDVQVTMMDGVVVTFANVASGSILPVRIEELNEGTSASDIIALS